MGKNQSASGLTNVIQYSNGNITFVSGSTTLMSISSSGAITTTGVISGSNALSASYASASTSASYSSNADALASSFTAFSSSILAQTASFNAFSASIYTATSSFSGRVGALESYTASLNLKTASFATTGSNNFTAVQHIADTTNPTGFDTTASLYTEGGFGIKKDTYISSSLYIKGNLTVYGTQSVCYITSSQLNIASNLISVNTATPSVRFGGLAVYDSGSTGLTGSILWDSQNNHWVYSNPSGSTYSGGMFISGPRTATLGSETGTTACALMMGQGGDHITSSAIFHYGNATCFYGNSFISSSGAACFANTVCAPTLVVNNQTNISPDANGTGQLMIQGNGYQGYTALDATAMYVGHNSQVRNLTFQTNETNRLTINGDGIACFACQICAPVSVVTGASIVSGCLGIGTGTPRTKAEFSSGLPTSIPTHTNTTNGIVVSDGGDIYGRIGVSNFSAGGSGYPTYIQAGDYSGAIYYNLLLQPLGGNVGIGTTAPAKALTVINTGEQLRLSYSSGVYTDFRNDSAGGLLINTSDGYIINYIGGSAKMRIDPGSICFACQICAPAAIFTGCVGIGITSPTTKLDVYAGVCTSAIIWGQTIRNEGNAATTGYGIGLKLKISGDSVPNELYKWAGITAVAGTDYSNRTDLAFYTNAASVAHATEKIRITGDGNLGIGTCAPNEKLTVWTSSTTGLQTALRLNNPFGFANQNTGAQIVFSQDRSVAEDLKQGIIAVGQQDAGTSATSFMAFYTNNTGLGERLRINSEGVACFSKTICTPVAMIGSSCSPYAGINYLGREGYREKWLITQGRYRFCFGTEDFYAAIFIEMYGTNYNQGTSEVRVGKAVIPLRYATSRSIVQVYDAGGVCVGAYRTNGIGLVWCNINGTVGDLIYTNAGSQQPDSVLATELQLLSNGFSLVGRFYRMCHTNVLYDSTNPYV